MKKLIALIFILVPLSFGVITAITVDINKNKDTVTYTEKTLYGDASFANGAVIQTSSTYQNHLVWDSVYTIGEKSETDFNFYFNHHYKNSKIDVTTFFLDNSVGISLNLNVTAAEQSGLSKLVREIYDSLKYGEEKSTTVKLSDYYEYYPLEINLHLQSLNLNISEDSFASGNSLYTVSDQNEKKIYEDIRSFLKIPVIENEYVDVSVHKHSTGTTGLGFSYADKSADHYSMSSLSVHNENAIYFTIGNRTENGATVDFSHVPGGYGIYVLPYTDATVQTEKLALAYSLDENATVTSMKLHGNKLLLTLTENGISYLETVEISTMTQLQKVKLADGEHYAVYTEEDFIVYVFNDKIVVLEEKDGLYDIAFITDNSSSDSSKDTYFYFRSSAALDFDGERLIIADNASNSYECGFRVLVYTAEGLKYFGEYESSLDINSDATSYSSECHPLGSMEVKWKN